MGLKGTLGTHLCLHLEFTAQEMVLGQWKFRVVTIHQRWLVGLCSFIHLLVNYSTSECCSVVNATSSQLCSLFYHLLLFCEVSNPRLLWEEAYGKMSDDYLYNLKSTLPDKNFCVTDDLLHELEHTLRSFVPSRLLADFDLPMPSSTILSIVHNRLILEEMSYDNKVLFDQHAQLLPQLNSH
uniref:Uncharacterized protein n=1 Tax=Lactuca sativa TaxID=4236 RepID=A0A9R1VYD9_LACSA|nr:hypothetical protein LSAT_V11C400161700 [Lactuca sativa]